ECLMVQTEPVCGLLHHGREAEVCSSSHDRHYVVRFATNQVLLLKSACHGTKQGVAFRDMSTQTETGRPSLEDIVAGNIRAEMARAGLSQSDVARALHVPRSWVSTRYRGVARWSIADVERVA